MSKQVITRTTHTDLQAADASEPHFNALVLEAGVAVYPRPAWWMPDMRVAYTRHETWKWGDFPAHDGPAYWSLLAVLPGSMREHMPAAGFPITYAILDDTVEFWPSPLGGEVVVPV